MSRPPLHGARKTLQWLTVGLGVMTLAVVVTAIEQGRLLGGAPPSQAHARSHAMEDDLCGGHGEGDHRPGGYQRDHPDSRRCRAHDARRAHGYRGRETRFWGYCFPENYDRNDALKTRRFPGTVFFSHKEREMRERQQQNQRRESFTVEQNLTEEDLNEERTYRGAIRHQQEIFLPGTSCYLMTEAPLPIGVDNDRDRANAAVERDVGSDSQNADTDADGVKDGPEVFTLGTNPVLRDSDGDGLIDGLEDRDQDGRRDLDETDATKWDTDNDGLCDGFAR